MTEARMTHADPSQVPAGPFFSDEEWQKLQDDDLHAGKAIICLMAGIFVIGLALYTIVALWVA